ncbi:MAG: aldose 1-epimerase [Sphingomicrobium sp.]
MADRPLKLRAGSLELELSPSIGGAISNFAWAAGELRTPILRQSHSPLEKVLDAAGFPLVPFVNRIRGGCFTFQGRQIRLSPNMAGDPCPLHGQGWVNPWRTESASEAEAVLVFSHESGEWPWAYEARHTFRLVGDTLCLRLSCRNTSDEPMPCGLGFHPYFPCGPDTVIQTSVQNVWTIDDDVLPVDRIPATGRYDIGDAAACGRDLDNGYDGWSGRALLTDPGWPFEIVLSSPQARFFQLYSPKQGGVFVAEPVTHANAALNAPQQDWASLGIRVLQPGEKIALDARLEIQPK